MSDLSLRNTGTTQAKPIRLPRFPDGGLPVPDPAWRLFVIRSVGLVALFMTLVYLSWRTFFTVELSVWWLSIPMLLLEFHAFAGLALFTFSLWDTSAQPPARKVTSTPHSIAVLIPTYDESPEVLLPTIAAAIALEPRHETWVLDDGRRPEVAEIAYELGAHYLTRPDNENAKAGNINHALAHVDVDFIAVLDADHVAAPGFLMNTLGYFDDSRVALVQTPQDFYNLNSFEHAEHWDENPIDNRHRYHEQALFYRVIQPAKNRWGGAFWCGTNAIVRTSALREIGGVATDTLTEDIHTTIRLHRRGWKTVYHNEVLARGLAAASADQFTLQRHRWCTGAMQVLRAENPLTVSGLSLVQRLSYAKTLLGWFDSWRTLGFLLIPPIVLFTGAVPIKANAITFLTLFGITLLAQNLAQRGLSRGYHHEHLRMVFELTRMAPNLDATLTLLRPTKSHFRVTPKGRVGDRRQRIPAPSLLYGLVAISCLAAGWFVLVLLNLAPLTYDVPWVAYGAAFWLAINVAFIFSAIRRIRSEAFGSERRAGFRFEAEVSGALDRTPCLIQDMSLSGARVVVPDPTTLPNELTLSLRPAGLPIRLRAEARSIRLNDKGEMIYGLLFAPAQYQARGLLALVVLNRLGVSPEQEVEFASRPVVEVERKPREVLSAPLGQPATA